MRGNCYVVGLSVVLASDILSINCKISAMLLSISAPDRSSLKREGGGGREGAGGGTGKKGGGGGGEGSEREEGGKGGGGRRNREEEGLGLLRVTTKLSMLILR